MSEKPGTSLRWRMAFWLSVSMATVTITLVGYYHYRLDRLLEADGEQQIATLARHLASTAELGVLAGSEELLAPTLKAALAQDEVRAVAVYDTQGALLASVGRQNGSPASWTGDVTRCRPCALGDEQTRWTEAVTTSAAGTQGTLFEPGVEAPEQDIAGWVILDVSATARIRAGRSLLLDGLGVAATVLLLAVLGALALAVRITAPLRLLADATREIARNRFDVALPHGSPGELQELAMEFRAMTTALAELDRENRAYREDLEQMVEERTEELQHAYDRMKALAEAKDQFVATVSHDFRSPLAIILSSIQTVAADPDMPDEVRVNFLGRAERQCRRLRRLVNDLLDLARIENRETNLESRDVTPIVAELVDGMRPRFDEKGVELLLQLPEAHLAARLDRSLFEQALANLLDNALKFSEPAGHVTVTVAHAQHDGEIAISVRDDGPGIAPEDVPHLFDRFFQSDAHASKGEGSGLGLAIVSEILRKHGGRVNVDSTLGEGTNFEIFLPGTKHQGEED